MADEKDRFGDKLRDKERAEEDLFFNKRDEALLEKMRLQKASGAAVTGGMRCPKDGTALVTVDHHGVSVEECPTCSGLWLNKGELETIAKREKDSWIGRLVYGPRK
jgi:hypothetical protein